MKIMKQLWCAIGWWRIGVRPVKAWQLAKHNVRKTTYGKELAVGAALVIGYLATSYIDEMAAGREAHRELATKTANHAQIESAVAECMNGKMVRMDDKSIMTCRVYTES